MKEKNKKSEEKDIFDEFLIIVKHFRITNVLLKKFNIFSIAIGIISFFIYSLLLGLIALILGIIAKRDKERGATFGIILSILSISLVLIRWIIEDISTGNYRSLIKAIIMIIIFTVLKFGGFFDRKKSEYLSKESKIHEPKN
ncbi:MAG: hypothetical protein WC650_04210 [Candidatus Doudnabacteria bacterium]